AVPVRCGPVPLTSALWPPRRPHVPPACQYRLALRVAFVPRAPVAMRDAYPWPQGTTGEDRVSRLKFSLSERLRNHDTEKSGIINAPGCPESMGGKAAEPFGRITHACVCVMSGMSPWY